MNLEKLEKLFQEIKETTHETLHVDILKRDKYFSQIVIPFSQIFKTYKPIDLYSGKEKIPFNERDPEYRMILNHEFSNLLKI